MIGSRINSQEKFIGDLDFHIRDIDIAKYLGIKLYTLRMRLLNKYSNDNVNYLENADYVKVKSGKGRTLTYMINYACFERLAMSGQTEQSETIRMYFVKLREFLTENQNVIYQAMENKEDLKKYSGFESIYFFAVNDRRHDNFFKVGHTLNIVHRLRNYNVGRIKDVELKYFALVKNRLLIEKCVKMKLKRNQVIARREIYQVDPIMLKKVIDECYCKNVNVAENEELHAELAQLLGLYAYVRDKKHIKPYVIIDKIETS